MFLLPVRVSCYSGGKADETPRVLHEVEGRSVRVLEIRDRWYEGSRDETRAPVEYFKVLGEDDREYLLRHDRQAEQWYWCVK